MQKRLHFIKGHSGFVLPYVLFLTTIIILILSTSIRLYHNEVRITQMEIEDIKLETLLQMGYATYLEETTEVPHDKIHYQFSEGNVSIEYVETSHSIYMTITTDQETTRSFSVPLNDHNFQ